MILMIIGEIKYLTDKITKDSGVKAAILFLFYNHSYACYKNFPSIYNITSMQKAYAKPKSG